MKKKLSILLVIVMMFVSPMQASAQEQHYFSDMPNNWSTEALTEAVTQGLMSGYNGKIYPEKSLTRAEMAAVINRALGAKESVDISSYTDVKPTDWFYGEMSKAVGMGTFHGYVNQLRPNEPITREEVFSVLSSILKLKAEKANIVFTDSNEVSSWAQESINGMINGGYISGSNGKLNPKANITRAEFAQVMHNIIKDYVNTATAYEEINEGNVIVNTPNATLKNVTVKGDLIIAEGVGEGEVTLDNVKVEGRMLVRAGGENSIIIKGDSEIDKIVIVKQGNKVRIFNETGKEIAVATVEGTADVILEGDFKNIVIQSPNITVYAQDAEIKNVEINGTRSKVIVDDKSEIEKVVVRAANVVIEGKGTIEKVEVKAGGSGTEITTPETQIDVDRGANNVVGTGGVEIEPNETYVNGKTQTQDAKQLDQTSSGGGSSGGSSGGSTTTPITNYTVNYSVVGSNGTLTGTVISGKSVNSGTSVTFTATPSTGYEIKEWKVNGVVTVSGSALTRTINANTAVTVEFKETLVAPTMYTVTYSVIGVGGLIEATVPNGGTVLAGSSVDFTAVPEEGYKLKEWIVNGEVIDWLTGLQVSRDMIGDVDFKVQFEPIVVAPTTHRVTFAGIGGTIEATVNGNMLTNGALVENGSSLEFIATPADGWELKHWKVNGTVDSSLTSNTITITPIEMDYSIEVEFKPITYTINYSVIGGIGNITASSSSYASVSDGMKVNRGTEITFSSDPVDGYRVKDWKVNGVSMGASSSVVLTFISEDKNVTLEFEEIPIVTYSLTVKVEPSGSIITVTDLSDNVMTGSFNGIQTTYDLPVGLYTIKIEKVGYVTQEFAQNMIGPSSHIITLDLINNVPVAVDDSAVVNEDSTVLIDVLANDTDVDGDTLSITGFTQGSNGTVAQEGDSLRYTPNANYNGADSFTYDISDGNGGTATATVGITINPVNDVPVAVDDSAVVNEDSTALIDVLANDTDVDGDTLSITGFTQGSNGTVTQEGDSLRYTPNANYNGADSFMYEISDGNGGIATATVNITVNPANNSPLATDDEVTVMNNMTILIDVLANDTDSDGDTLSITSYTQGANGIVTQEGDSLKYDPNTDFIGMDEFDYEISDGNGGTSSALVRVTVNPNGTKLGTGSYQGNDISFYMGDSGLIAVLEGQVSTIGDVVAENYTSVVDIVSMDNSVALIYMWEGNIEVSRVVAIGQNAVESEHSIIQAYGVISGIEYTVAYDEIIHFTYLDSQGSPDPYNKPDLMYSNTSNGSVILVQRAYQDLSSSGSWGADYIESGYTISVDNEGNPVVAYIRRNIWKWSNGNDTTFYLHIENPLTQENIIIENNYKTNIYSNLQLTGGGSKIGFSYDKSGVSVTGTITANPLSVDLP